MTYFLGILTGIATVLVPYGIYIWWSYYEGRKFSGLPDYKNTPPPPKLKG